MAKIDLQKMCDETLLEIRSGGSKPGMLLHACCAPCSSYVIEYLVGYFDLTVFFYNPNISSDEEFDKRHGELLRYICERYGGSIPVICPERDGDLFSSLAPGLETAPEGGERCMKCYALRLEKTAAAARKLGLGWFCSTLSVSPHKNAEALWRIGSAAAEKNGVRYLPSDFKKRGGYQRSIELSREYSLYRQDFCGCVFSAAEAEARRSMRPKGGHV